MNAVGLRHMETAPRDGTRFIAVIDGLPYLSYYDAIGRFIRIVHRNVEGMNARWELKAIDGQEWRRQVDPGEPLAYERYHVVWSRGFDFEPEGWMPQAAAGEEPAPIPTDEQIEAAFERLPGGVQGFLKSWGYQQFAREIWAMASHQRGAP